MELLHAAVDDEVSLIGHTLDFEVFLREKGFLNVPNSVAAEGRLLWGILERALRDLEDPTSTHYLDAKEWVDGDVEESPDDPPLTSFNYISLYIVGCDPIVFRSCIYKYYRIV